MEEDFHCGHHVKQALQAADALTIRRPQRKPVFECTLRFATQFLIQWVTKEALGGSLCLMISCGSTCPTLPHHPACELLLSHLPLCW